MTMMWLLRLMIMPLVFMFCHADESYKVCRDALFMQSASTDELTIMSTASGGLKYGGGGLYDVCENHQSTHYCSILPLYAGLCVPSVCSVQDLGSSDLVADVYGATNLPAAQALVVKAGLSACPFPFDCEGCKASCVDSTLLAAAAKDAASATTLLSIAARALENVLPETAVSLQAMAAQLATGATSDAPAMVYYTVAGELSALMATYPLSADAATFLTGTIIPALGALSSGAVSAMCGGNEAEVGAGAIVMLSLSSLLAAFALTGTAISVYESGPGKVPGSFLQSYRTHGVLGGVSALWGWFTGLFAASGDERFSLVAGGGADEPLLSVEPINGDEGGSDKRGGEVAPLALSPGWDAAVLSFLAHFDLCMNVRELMSLKKRGGNFGVLDGMRALSMMWVVLGHMLVWQMQMGFENAQDVYTPDGLATRFSAQAITGALFSVDTFFFMGGFLGSYILIRKLRAPRSSLAQQGPLRWVPMAVLQRWLRLTPAVMFVIFLDTYVVAFMGSGPFWFIHRGSEEQCKHSWWTNLLFISNLHPWKSSEMCYGVLWYLPNDMQFFVLGIVLVAFYPRAPKTVFALTCALMLASLGYGLYLVEDQDMTVVLVDPHYSKYDEDWYRRPWTRAAAYLVGVLTAMLWSEWGTGQDSVKLSPRMRTALSVSAAVTLGACCYGAYDGYRVDANAQPLWSDLERVIYTGATRPVWCIGLALMCWVCFKHQGGWVESFLSAKAWLPVARLSFCAYLCHPMILALMFWSESRLRRYTYLEYAFTYGSALLYTFALAGVVHLLVEKPASGIVTALLSPPPRRNHRAAAPATDELQRQPQGEGGRLSGAFVVDGDGKRLASNGDVEAGAVARKISNNNNNVE